MQRIALATVFSISLSAAGFAQSSFTPYDPVDPSLKLSDADLQNGAASYPFEDELNGCIKKDILNRGIGPSCPGILFKYCPEPEMGESLYSGIRCVNFGTDYWQTRLDDALAGLVPLYKEQDNEKPKETQRAPRLVDLQQKWIAWRTAHCDFENYKEPDRSQWGMLDGANCEYQLTSTRALEVETLLRVASY